MSLAGRVLLTGGAGFLGRGILRRAKAENWNTEFIVYSRDAQKQAVCKRKYPDIRYVLGDIRDGDRLRLCMLGVDSVIHTAALKHVPEAEVNVGECVSVNVDGTRTVLLAAYESNVSNMVTISTDKAVAPANVYGMTKAISERLMTEIASVDSATKYTGVRYGNVIGSTGSVVPVLRDQAQRYGLISLTNPAMTRFWITIDDAIDLIIAATDNLVSQGSILIPAPQSMTLGDLANTILPDVEIKVVGERPGEKLHEDLITENESSWAYQTHGYYELLSLAQRTKYNQNTEVFSLNSFDADRIVAEDFLRAVEDAANV